MQKFTHPDSVRVPRRGGDSPLLHFSGYSQITGDAMYRGYDSKGAEIHALVPNPHAVDNQATYLKRGG